MSRKSQIQGLFKDIQGHGYQQIVQKGHNFNEFQTTLSDIVNTQNQQKEKERRSSTTSLQIQRYSRSLIFVFKFKDIQGLSSFVRALCQIFTK
jgi:hypothetical protein